MLGYRIIENHRKAQHVTSIDLDEGQYGFLSPEINKKGAGAITGKLTLDNFERNSATDYKQQNFSPLHRKQIYPVAENMARAQEMHRSLNQTPNELLQSPTRLRNAQTILDELDLSPRGISPTNSRLDYLVKAKASR